MSDLKSKKEASILGFGAMRLPYTYVGDKEVIKQDAVNELVLTCYNNGITVYDTAHTYNFGESEKALGVAIKALPREKIILSTKISIKQFNTIGSLRSAVDESFARLDVDYLDILFLHDLRNEVWSEWSKLTDNVEYLLELKSSGKIKTLYFSSHDTPDNVQDLIAAGFFDGVLLQYNMLDNAYEDCFQKAKARGMSTWVMGPLAGGQIAGDADEWNRAIDEAGCKDSIELGLNYVKSNENIDVILSGMCDVNSVCNNVRSLQTVIDINDKCRRLIKEIKEEFESRADVYCTWCKYCLPCPCSINIPLNIKAYKMWKIYGARRAAERIIERMNKDPLLPGKQYYHCEECGVCEGKCPQKLPIIQMFREMKGMFGE